MQFKTLNKYNLKLIIYQKFWLNKYHNYHKVLILLVHGL